MDRACFVVRCKPKLESTSSGFLRDVSACLQQKYRKQISRPRCYKYAVILNTTCTGLQGGRGQNARTIDRLQNCAEMQQSIPNVGPTNRSLLWPVHWMPIQALRLRKGENGSKIALRSSSAALFLSAFFWVLARVLEAGERAGGWRMGFKPGIYHLMCARTPIPL